MKIVERQVGDVVILDLHGKILIGEGDDALREAVTKLADSGKTKILLNLAEVPYVDSAGLGEIVRTYTTVSRKGGKLKLLNLTKKIEDLLSMIPPIGRQAGRGGLVRVPAPPRSGAR